MAGLAYHNFTSAAAGIALAIAFIRGISRRERDTLGNFWVDMTRATLWVLLPFCLVGALLLVAGGAPQNLKPYTVAKIVDPQKMEKTYTGGRTTTEIITEQKIAQGQVASQADTEKLQAENPGKPVPVDMVTTSASGLDPHISPAAAEFQIPRVAKERGMSEDAIRQIVAEFTEGRQFGFLGEPRVNALPLNLALDERMPMK
jgi:hypothetical protein